MVNYNTIPISVRQSKSDSSYLMTKIARKLQKTKNNFQNNAASETLAMTSTTELIGGENEAKS